MYPFLFSQDENFKSSSLSVQDGVELHTPAISEKPSPLQTQTHFFYVS